MKHLLAATGIVCNWWCISYSYWYFYCVSFLQLQTNHAEYEFTCVVEMSLTVTGLDHFECCLFWWHCFLSVACAVCWGGGVSQQPVGPITGRAGPRGWALPAAWAQRRRLASLFQHGSLRPGGVQLLPAAHLLHCLHLWLVSTEWVSPWSVATRAWCI